MYDLNSWKTEQPLASSGGNEVLRRDDRMYLENVMSIKLWPWLTTFELNI